MPYYKYLDIPNWEQTANEMRTFVLANYKTIFADHESALHVPDKNFLLKEIPSLQKILDHLNGTIFFAGFHITPSDCSTIHMDDGIAISRINFPIINCEYSRTVFYECRQYDVVAQANGFLFKDCKEENCTEVDSFTLDRPVMLKVFEPHKVVMLKDEYPRISFTMQINEPIEHWYD